jgi:GLPGLI family protein
MKKLSLSFLLAFAMMSFTYVSAQLNECKISYNIDVSGADMEPMAKAMMKNAKMELSFKGTSSRMVMNMGMMGSTTVITNDESKKGLMLMNMMGMKFATPMDEETMEKGKEDAPAMNYEITGKSKKIADYTCKQAIGTDEEGNSFEIWFSDKISPRSFGKDFDFKGIDGFPLEMETMSDGVKMKMIAQSVSTKGLDDADFSMEIPEGYTERSMEELQNMGGR